MTQGSSELQGPGKAQLTCTRTYFSSKRTKALLCSTVQHKAATSRCNLWTILYSLILKKKMSNSNFKKLCSDLILLNAGMMMKRRNGLAYSKRYDMLLELPAWLHA